MIIGLALKDARFQWKRRENDTPVASTETQAQEKIPSVAIGTPGIAFFLICYK